MNRMIVSVLSHLERPLNARPAYLIYMMLRQTRMMSPNELDRTVCSWAEKVEHVSRTDQERAEFAPDLRQGVDDRPVRKAWRLVGLLILFKKESQTVVAKPEYIFADLLGIYLLCAEAADASECAADADEMIKHQDIEMQWRLVFPDALVVCPEYEAHLFRRHLIPAGRNLYCRVFRSIKLYRCHTVKNFSLGSL